MLPDHSAARCRLATSVVRMDQVAVPGTRLTGSVKGDRPVRPAGDHGAAIECRAGPRLGERPGGQAAGASLARTPGLARHRQIHPEVPPMSEKEFFRFAIDRRYAKAGPRCC